MSSVYEIEDHTSKKIINFILRSACGTLVNCCEVKLAE